MRWSSLSAGRDARLDYCTVQQWGAGVWHIAAAAGTLLDANAKLRFTGAHARRAAAEGRGGRCCSTASAARPTSSASASATARSTSIISRCRRTRGAETRSNLLLKVAVRDQARSVYAGLDRRGPVGGARRRLRRQPQPPAQPGRQGELGSRGWRSARTTSSADTARRLGHIDADQRFYLMSRGVPPDEASSLIVRGFMDDVLDRRPTPRLRRARRHAARRGDRRPYRGRGRAAVVSDGWVEVAHTSDIPPGCAARVEIDDVPDRDLQRRGDVLRARRHLQPCRGVAERGRSRPRPLRHRVPPPRLELRPAHR